MVRQPAKTSTIISLALHLGIIALLMVYSKPVTLLLPSRSDGIEVSLVSMPNQTIRHYSPPLKIIQAAHLKTLDSPADINIKQNAKAQPKPVKPEPQPKVEPKIAKMLPPKDNTKTQAPNSSKSKAQNSKVQVNDLLGDVLSKNTTAVRKGKALGGNPNGTSDSNNLLGNYADQVINVVRPFVLIPEDINPNAKAVVKVELNPDLSVRKVSLLQSSGNDIYDQNIQTAILRVKVFPPLPDGAKYVDFRILKLIFRPQ